MIEIREGYGEGDDDGAEDASRLEYATSLDRIPRKIDFYSFSDLDISKLKVNKRGSAEFEMEYKFRDLTGVITGMILSNQSTWKLHVYDKRKKSVKFYLEVDDEDEPMFWWRNS